MNYDYDFTETDVYVIESFILLADYNRYEQDILDIMEQLQEMFQSKAEYDCATRPHWTLKCGRDKVDEFGGIFWAWLVLQYGDMVLHLDLDGFIKKLQKSFIILCQIFVIHTNRE